MREYTAKKPVFADKISIVEEDDLVNAENDTAAAKQLLQNDLALAARIEKLFGSNNLEFVEGIKADNVIDAINEVFQSGNEVKNNLVDNFVARGVSASTDETIGQLIDKILDMADTSRDTVISGVLLEGYTAHDAAGKPITGDMTECGAWTGKTTGSGNVAIPAGHHNGKGYVSGKGAYDKGVADADGRTNVDSANYKGGYNAGVNATKKGTAVAADVLVGKTFTNNSAVGANGGMANKGGTTVDAGAVTQDDNYTYLSVPAAGYYDTNSKLRTANSNLKLSRVAFVSGTATLDFVPDG
ncbi:MAG: hypothetical protein K2O91_11030, partial [Lachnospiraceae bacterium]|nr:hypothetical protein [Lachnospiraceae bacterium]